MPPAWPAAWIERPESADLAVAVLAPRGQLVFRRGDRLAVVGALAGKICDSAGQLAHRSGDSDAEHALSALQQVDDFFGRGALVNRGPVGEQRDVGQVLHAALTQVVNRDADVVQGDPGVEQTLDDLEHEDVFERVQPLAAGSGGAPDRRYYQ